MEKLGNWTLANLANATVVNQDALWKGALLSLALQIKLYDNFRDNAVPNALSSMGFARSSETLTTRPSTESSIVFKGRANTNWLRIA